MASWLVGTHKENAQARMTPGGTDSQWLLHSQRFGYTDPQISFLLVVSLQSYFYTSGLGKNQASNHRNPRYLKDRGITRAESQPSNST